MFFPSFGFALHDFLDSWCHFTLFLACLSFDHPRNGARQFHIWDVNNVAWILIDWLDLVATNVDLCAHNRLVFFVRIVTCLGGDVVSVTLFAAGVNAHKLAVGNGPGGSISGAVHSSHELSFIHMIQFFNLLELRVQFLQSIWLLQEGKNLVSREGNFGLPSRCHSALVFHLKHHTRLVCKLFPLWVF